MQIADKPANEVQRLAALRSYGLLDSARETNFDSVVKLAARLTGAASSMISLIDTDRQWLKASFALDIAETPRDVAFCAHTILVPNELMVVTDAHQDPRFADNPLVTGDPGIRFYAGQPLVNPEGLAVGTLCVMDPSPRDLTDDQRYALKVLADSLMTTLEFRRLARIDALTGLPNRIALAHATEQAIEAQRRHGRPFALLQLVLDGVTRIDDGNDPEAGDSLLRHIGRLLVSHLDDQDMVARVGGEAFAVLVRHDPHEPLPALTLHRAIADALAAAGSPAILSLGAVTFLAAPEDATAALSAVEGACDAAGSGGCIQLTHRIDGVCKTS